MAKKKAKRKPPPKAKASRRKSPKRAARKRSPAPRKPSRPKVATVAASQVPLPSRGRPASVYGWLYEALDALKPGKALRMGGGKKGLTRAEVAGIRQAARRWTGRTGVRVRTTTVSGALYLVRIIEQGSRPGPAK